MILLDTNILSTFAAIYKLQLLEQIFSGKELAISVNVLKEIKIGREKGYMHLEKVLVYTLEKKIVLLETTNEEEKIASELPSVFGPGERDSIAIAKSRDYIFVTNEEKAIKYCLREGITCFWLNVLLRALWSENIMSKEEVKALISLIEQKDRIKIKDVNDIFEE